MPQIDRAILRLVCELAHDGVWTLPQFDARRDRWTCPQIPPRYMKVAEASLRPTGYSRLPVRVPIVRPTPAAVEIAQAHSIDVAAVRSDQLEHSVGLAELRWRSGVPARHSVSGETLLRAQNHLRSLGCNESFRAVPDGAYRHKHGVVLCEYDTGRYSARQVRAKIAAGRSIRRLEGCQIIGHLWGVPTQERAKWLRDRGVGLVTVVPVSSWLAVASRLFEKERRVVF